MRKQPFFHLFLPLLLGIPLFLAGCSPSVTGPPNAVESYFEALAAKDQNKMINLSCTAWEAQARLEYDSFAAVDVTLEDVICTESDQAGDFTIVNCTGRLIASYGAEDLVIELSEHPIQAIQQEGEWRMCGYH